MSSSFPSDLSTCPALETVVEAIHTMSGANSAHTDPRKQEEAAKWLQMLQKSVHAWKVRTQRLLKTIKGFFVDLSRPLRRPLSAMYKA